MWQSLAHNSNKQILSNTFIFLFKKFLFISDITTTMADTKVVAESATVDAEMMPPPPTTTQEKADMLKIEEEKLKSKFPNLPGRPSARGRGGHSSFLQNRLGKGQKFFDSGDYQVCCIIH
jgi:hypothetical protein